MHAVVGDSQLYNLGNDDIFGCQQHSHSSSAPRRNHKAAILCHCKVHTRLLHPGTEWMNRSWMVSHEWLEQFRSTTQTVRPPIILSNASCSFQNFESSRNSRYIIKATQIRTKPCPLKLPFSEISQGRYHTEINKNLKM